MTSEQRERNRKLVEALRSGNYQQATGFLWNPEWGYCCLGVACDLVKDELKMEWEIPAGGPAVFDKETTTVPKAVMELYGWSSTNPDVIDHENENSNSLAYLNDHLHYSFNQIATVIEENFVEVS